jgi:2'-5' RNA ligase/peptidoglycan hydrolase-like protein with peptidoglycan-binding domain
VRAVVDDVNTGATVALLPTQEDADRLAVDGGEDAAQLHVTLVYLGDAVDFDDAARNAIHRAAVSIAAEYPPFDADGFAISLFNPGSDDRDQCIVLTLGGEDLCVLHREACGEVEGAAVGAGAVLAEQHEPFHPHITLIYTDDTSLVGEVTDRTGPVSFDRIRVAFGDTVHDYPLTGSSMDMQDMGEGEPMAADQPDGEGAGYGARAVPYDPELHPHAAAGSPQGGQFTSKDNKSGSSGSTPPAKKAPAKKAAPAMKKPVHHQPAKHTPAPKKAAPKHAPSLDLLAHPPKHAPVLKAGGKNDPGRVKQLQGLLKALGVGGMTADGTYGSSTTVAVADAQRKLGMSPTGHASATFIRKLQTAMALSPCVKRSELGDDEYDELMRSDVSGKPWSGFTEADYTPQQWWDACLIHRDGATRDTKTGSSLPVREPDGTLNRNAVHAAAGGHGITAVKGISDAQRATAAKALVRLYRDELDDDPPESLLALAGAQRSLDVDGVEDLRTRYLTEDTAWMASRTPHADLRRALVDELDDEDTAGRLASAWLFEALEKGTDGG